MLMKRVKKTTTAGFNALVWKEAGLFVAKAVEVEVASQGKTAQDALKNLEEAIELYFEDEKIPASKITLLAQLRLSRVNPKITYA